MRNFDMNKGIEPEPIDYIEFEKAVDLIGLIVVEEVGLFAFTKSLDELEAKGRAGTITTDELESLEKGKKDVSKLIKKQVIGKDGKKKTVYVKAGATPKAEEGKKKPEDHARDTHDHKLNKYINEGKDEDLKKVAKDEMNRRKSEASKAKYAAAQGGDKKPQAKKPDGKKDDKNINMPIGKTKSGKHVFHTHSKEVHEGFTSKDHDDAVDMHKTEKSKSILHPKIEDVKKHSDHHSKQAEEHAKLSNSKKLIEKLSRESGNAEPKETKKPDDKYHVITGRTNKLGKQVVSLHHQNLSKEAYESAKKTGKHKQMDYYSNPPVEKDFDVMHAFSDSEVMHKDITPMAKDLSDLGFEVSQPMITSKRETQVRVWADDDKSDITQDKANKLIKEVLAKYPEATVQRERAVQYDPTSRIFIQFPYKETK